MITVGYIVLIIIGLIVVGGLIGALVASIGIGVSKVVAPRDEPHIGFGLFMLVIIFLGFCALMAILNLLS